jgi:chaperone modulatory protein CbpM
MISIDVLVAEVSGLNRQDLDLWIAQSWVRPDDDAGDLMFQDIDVARIKLILELRGTMEIDDHAMPVVLSLLDQLYDMRRQVQALGTAITETAPDDVQRALAQRLTQQMRGVLH